MESSEIIVLLAIGLVAGWIASRIVTGGSGSLLGSLVVGVLGAYIGPLLLAAVDVNPPAGLLGSIVTAVVGAGALLLVVQVVGSLMLVVIGAIVLLIVLGGVSLSLN